VPYELVKMAIEKARTRDPSVKAMALLHGSRVMAAMDRKLASEFYAEGIAAAESLTLPPRRTQLLRPGSVGEPTGPNGNSFHCSRVTGGNWSHLSSRLGWTKSSTPSRPILTSQ
jgi:hypothetical protein